MNEARQLLCQAGESSNILMLEFTYVCLEFFHWLKWSGR